MKLLTEIKKEHDLVRYTTMGCPVRTAHLVHEGAVYVIMASAAAPRMPASF